ncbi:hypothetical protein Tco_0032305 [Tanacetum coccineum]
MSYEDTMNVGLRYLGDLGFGWNSTLWIKWKASRLSKALKEIFLEFKDVSHDFIPDERCVWIDPGGSAIGKSWSRESLHRVIESFIISYRNRTYCIIATEFAYWAPNIESMEVNSESNPLERKDAEGPSLDESLENEEHLDVDSCDSDSPKKLTMIPVSPF